MQCRVCVAVYPLNSTELLEILKNELLGKKSLDIAEQNQDLSDWITRKKGNFGNWYYIFFCSIIKIN